MIPAYLERLDQKQKEAVVSKAKYLQILAGPGSGKTRVLTSRIAYLVKEKNIPPNNIFVATFTKKASLEMRERLNNEELLGPTVSVQLNMGTFHSLCAYYLRQHAALVKLPNNFRIIDNQESIKILEQVIKERMGSISALYLLLPGECQTKISKAKNKGFTAETYALLHESSMHPGDHDGIMIFWAYDQRLSLEHLVDFDDLLLYGRALFEGFPEVMAHVNHVLVDEFQDTNNVQYDIVNYLCNKRKHLTIVGDPDQSIYGFRNANVANFRLMQQDFEGTMVIQLEQNYRSTSSILDGAFQVIQKDTERIDKGLYTRNSAGTPLSLLNCKTEQDEGRVIADEIIRTIEYSHGLIQYKDIAVLVRMHYLTQNMESVFNKSKIPYEIIGGVRFFERVEVRDLTAYIHFIYNTNDTISFERIINIPLRGVGQILSDKISTLSRVQDKTVLDILDHFCSENCRPGKYQLAGYTVSEKVMDHLRDFVGLCAHVKIMMDKKESVEAILKEVIDRTLYEDHLKKTYKDHEIRWENVGELISVAHSHDTNMDAFISRTTLEPDLDNTSQNDKVKIMTIHAAKGKIDSFISMYNV
ncbi:P-loop containing nucleoside triphosphate hydrolase protein [Chlamydoabsidia padenii]|nr:P-loop containing nucleoside triphosphate hydrolase protein [Chlamydoabsidia padenii]